MIKVGCLDFFEYSNEGNNDRKYGGFEQNGSQFYEILVQPLLEKGIEIEPCNCLKEECDIVFISCYPRRLSEFIVGNPIIIFWTYESMYKFNIETNYNYSISFWGDNNKNLHYPWWQHEYWRFKETYNPNKGNIVKDKFCAFVASNTNFIRPNFNDGVYLREYIAQEISKTYKKIDCYGYTKINNMDGALIPWDIHEANEVLSKYKFYFCFENSLSVNDEFYTTEKLINGFAYNCVPIYWGNHPEYLDKYFNPKSYINCTGMTPAEIIETIKYYDTHDDEYYAMLNENPFNDMSIDWEQYSRNRYVDFMIKLFEDNNIDYTPCADDTNILNYFDFLENKYTNKLDEEDKYKIYLINNKKRLTVKNLKYVSSDIYTAHCKILSYPQTTIPNITNIRYDLDKCDNIFQYDHCMGEFSKLYYIYHNENYKQYKYTGLTNYYQLWKISTLSSIDLIFDSYDIICPKETYTPEDTYTRLKFGCGELDEFINICKEKFPEYSNTIDEQLKLNHHYCYCMFIIKSEELEDYYNFISTIIFEYLNRHNLKNDADIYKYVEEHPEYYYYDNNDEANNIDNVSKYFSIIQELFTHIYIMHNYKNRCDVEYVNYPTEFETEYIKTTDDFKFYICNHLKKLWFNSIPEEVEYINKTKNYFTFINFPIRKDFPGFNNVNIDLSKDNLFELDMLYSEYAKMYYIWKNENLDNVKYIGNFHYRRYFNEDIYDNIYEYVYNYDCILVENKGQKDWVDLLVNRIGKEKLKLSFNSLDMDDLLQNDFYSCNMFIMKKEDFIKYMEWSSSILIDLQHQLHIFTEDDYYDWRENIADKAIAEGIDTNGLDITLEQIIYRYIAYFSEIIFSYWIKKNIHPDKIFVTNIVFADVFKNLGVNNNGRQEMKLYVFNHLNNLPEEIVNNYTDTNKYAFLSYPQTIIPNVDNIEYDLPTCDNIFEYDHSIGELAKMYFIYKNYDYRNYNYTGFVHYRRFFYNDTIDNINDIFNEYDVILPKINQNPDEVDNYTKIKWGCLVFDDFINICEELFPEYHETLTQELKSSRMYCHHIFIMKSDDLDKYINFMYNIAMTYIERNNLIDDNDIRNKIEEDNMKYCWWNKDENDEETLYQAARFIATAMEFFSHLFFVHNYNRIYESGYTFIENI